MRTNSPLIALSVLFCALNITQAQSQSGSPGPETRPRTVRSEVLPSETTPPAQSKTPTPQPEPGSVENIVVAPGANTSAESAIEPGDMNATSAQQIAPSTIRARIAEAERLLRTRPRQTAITSPALDTVILAVLERGAARIHLLTVSKQIFLTKGSEVPLTTSRGTPVTLRILRSE